MVNGDWADEVDFRGKSAPHSQMQLRQTGNDENDERDDNDDVEGDDCSDDDEFNFDMAMHNSIQQFTAAASDDADGEEVYNVELQKAVPLSLLNQGKNVDDDDEKVEDGDQYQQQSQQKRRQQQQQQLAGSRAVFCSSDSSTSDPQQQQRQQQQQQQQQQLSSFAYSGVLRSALPGHSTGVGTWAGGASLQGNGARAKGPVFLMPQQPFCRLELTAKIESSSSSSSSCSSSSSSSPSNSSSSISSNSSNKKAVAAAAGAGGGVAENRPSSSSSPVYSSSSSSSTTEGGGAVVVVGDAVFAKSAKKKKGSSKKQKQNESCSRLAQSNKGSSDLTSTVTSKSSTGTKSSSCGSFILSKIGGKKRVASKQKKHGKK